ncbi:MAG: hypothetical protein IEMM0008_1833 [bacterium]|nr:MAG: hypothetical protein IEMM0008_1833 [bacterium]
MQIIEEYPGKPTRRQKLTSFLALFTSTGTLLCCALPAAIATVAGGAAVTTFVTTFPWLIPFSHYKGWIFLFAGIMIVLSGIITFRPQSKIVCSVTGGIGCEVAGGFSKTMFWVSAGVFTIGTFFAYFIVPILRWLEG